MEEEDEDSVSVTGTKVLDHPEKVPIRSIGGGVLGITLKKSILNALRVKAKKHRFLNVDVVLDEHGRLILVAETSEE